MLRLSSFLALAAVIVPILAAPAPEPASHHNNDPSSGNSGSSGDPGPYVGLPFAGRCPLEGASIIGAPAELPAPTEPLNFVTIALGTQNYTCSSDGVYTPVGAVAELFDISCLLGTNDPGALASQLMTFWEKAPALFTPQGVIDFFLPATSDIVAGQHYFVPNPKTGQGVSPKWDFSAQGQLKGALDAVVVVEKLAGAPAPTGEDDIDWLATNAIDGKLAAQVYRTDTRGGQAPDECEIPGNTLEVKYVSNYWFFGGSVKADHDNHGLRTHRPKKSSGSKSNKNKSKGSNNKYSSPKKGGSGWNFHY